MPQQKSNMCLYVYQSDVNQECYSADWFTRSVNSQDPAVKYVGNHESSS